MGLHVVLVLAGLLAGTEYVELAGWYVRMEHTVSLVHAVHAVVTVGCDSTKVHVAPTATAALELHAGLAHRKRVPLASMSFVGKQRLISRTVLNAE